MYFKKIIFIASCLLFLGGCEFSTELNTSTPQTDIFRLTFGEDIPRYTKVYGLDWNRRPLPAITKKRDEQRREVYELPFSLHHDTVRYVLESLPNNFDTLSLAYQKETQYRRNNEKSENYLYITAKDLRVVFGLTTLPAQDFQINGLTVKLAK